MGRLEHAGSTQEAFDACVARLARAQYGVVSRAQLAGIGATKGAIQHRLNQGRWEPMARDVFRIAGSPPTWRQAVLATCLAWGDGVATSHRGSGALWGLAGIDPGAPELTVPRGRRRDGPGIVHRGLLLPADVTVVDAIPVTTPARTLIDLASVAPADAVEEALDDALRRGLVSMPRMRARLAALARKGRPGITAMRALLQARSPAEPVPQSVFESRLLRELRRARLPEPLAQHRIRRGGRVVAVVDFAYSDQRLAIEAEGYRWHSGKRDWARDLARANALTLLGWRVIRVTWADLKDRPATVTAAIREALRVA